MSETKTDDAVEITELEKIEAERVDGVATPANGVPVLMMKALEQPAEPTLENGGLTINDARAAAGLQPATVLPGLSVPELAKALAEAIKPLLPEPASNQVVAGEEKKGHSKKAGRDKEQIESLVSDAVTKATKGLEERLAAAQTELAKVKALPIPGGPVMSIAVPPKAQQDDERARTAAYYREMAKTVVDPGAADSYRQLARQLEEPPKD